MSLKFYLFLLCLLCSLGAQAQGERTVSGTVQTEKGEPLPGATVFIKGTFIGSSTNQNGLFDIRNVNFSKAPVVLVVSFVGYTTQEIPLSEAATGLKVALKSSGALNEVVVSASRVAETVGRAPVSVERLDARQVANLTAPDLVAGLARLKSIDVTNSSMLSSSFSTRGFNSSRSDRVIQLADYMDTALPTLSSNVGNLLGVPILDVGSVEVVQGPASALYGANAFNGVLLTNSKDPFKETGLSVRLRGGNRNMLDGQLRYAVKLGERVAFKIAGGAIEATDFTADNRDATSPLITPTNNPAGSNLGYDAVSVYGDASTSYTTGALAGKTVFLPGYSEGDLIVGSNKTHSYKVMPSLSVLLTDRVKATVGYRYTNLSTVFQSASRYRFLNSGANQAFARVEGRNWFVRGFQTRDYSGGRDPQTDGSYNLGFLATNLIALQARDAAGNPVVSGTGAPVSYATRYFTTYAAAYNAAFASNGGNADAAAATARSTADTNAPLLQPGTQAFNDARGRIIHDPSATTGARLIIRSIVTEGSGQYNFTSKIADVTVGGAYRQYMLGSDGTIFADADGERIKNYEYGAYAQLSKSLLDDRLRLAAAGRADWFMNFKTSFSPRVSAVYSAGEERQHNFRASFSRAFRAPSQDLQYTHLDLGRAVALGNIGNGFQGYTTAVTSKIAGGILLPANSAQLATYEFNSGPLQLENVNSAEVGYRAQITKQFFIDMDYFYSIYNDFIVTQNFLGNVDGSRPSSAQILASAAVRFQSPTLANGTANPTRIIQISTNVDHVVRTNGAAIALGYTFSPALGLSGNYSYNQLLTTDFDAGQQSFFNTPKHKFNLGLDGQLLERKLSYNVNYRWVDSYLYESTFATGTLPVTQVFDAQLGYTVASLHTTFQAGGSNLFNSTNYQVYGAPSFGRLVYLGVLFDLK